ncbi:hypothetical protein [Streptomyces sp. NBC_00859]|uniref:hypothetical protein n=1 Tax=Streptomyces sp. NBC_00859 TaxID=2903682 RepID=UPI00386E8913|nr:hypothetical protein OG584_13785 [Streptomyces sp. NBC_00859]
MRKTLKKAAVVGATVLAFSGIAAGGAQAAQRQGADLKGTGTLQDCGNWGRALKSHGDIVDFACMVGSAPNTFELTPFYAS